MTITWLVLGNFHSQLELTKFKLPKYCRLNVVYLIMRNGYGINRQKTGDHSDMLTQKVKKNKLNAAKQRFRLSITVLTKVSVD